MINRSYQTIQPEQSGLPLSESERVDACCIVAREKVDLGDYDAGLSVLHPWWAMGEWPRHSGLTTQAAAELFLTAGILSSAVASTKKLEGGQKPAEALLSGAIALFEQVGQKKRASEGRIELAFSYFLQGLFDLARNNLTSSLDALTDQDNELRNIAQIRLATLEHHAGRLHDAFSLLNKTLPVIGDERPVIKGRFYLQFATLLKDLGVAEDDKRYFDRSLRYYERALIEFEKLENRRYTAIAENNLGYLLLILRRFDVAQEHLQRARGLFEKFGDQVRRAQVDETIARLYIGSEKYELGDHAIRLAVNTLEGSGEDALLAEALTTQGLILCRLGHRQEAKPIIERARRVAERCGDREGAGRALLILIEEMCDQLADDERREIGAQANQLLANSQQHATRERLRKCLETIAEAHTRHEAQREQEIHAQKMAALGELSFGVAHNVNNTLTGILGRAQLILRNSTDPGESRSRPRTDHQER